MFYFLIFYNHFFQHVNALCEKYDQETELTNFYKEKTRRNRHNLHSRVHGTRHVNPLDFNSLPAQAV